VVKQAKANTERTRHDEDVPAAQLPDGTDEAFDKKAAEKIAVAVQRHTVEYLMFNPNARPSLRENIGASKYNLVTPCKDRSNGREYWGVQAYAKRIGGRFNTEIEAAVFAQRFMEAMGWPKECRNFGPDGKFCFNYKAYLGLFDKFTSDIPGVYKSSVTGYFYGTKTQNGKSKSTGSSVRDIDAKEKLAALV
jgi:hypothetical protein